ncbi:Signal transduction histidine-protein kinase BaeS [Roseivivax jejudonensis]|uniref:histidine kinase n=1 Tax=Roseivivax jejudonensis TaxID=1529041 RepID=A0A1X7A2Z6_9RHOB|nr:HAMP domain-containing sensor histidine kinase [Roseivivax jejudonensis]SLN69118.1 Signal transduction histidine-protein kinase BaeS [Roseivivax jejudonensis]
MRAGRVLSSTPVRLALFLVALFTLVNGATLGGAYLQLAATTKAQIRQSVSAEMAGLDVTATPAALATLVGARARAAEPRNRVYVFLGDDGRRAGNADAVMRGGQPRLVALGPNRPLSDAGYVREVRRLSSGVLIVAESLAPLDALRRTFLALLVLSLVPTTLLSLGIGTLVARRSARRVTRIERTLAEIAGGDLTARYDPSDRAGDDLARIGQGVNRMAARQEAATDALRQVSADIAHDLRTPLQRISVLLEDLRADLPEETRAADLARRAESEAARATAVFRALLQIAQIEGGSPAQGFGPVDLSALAAEMVELYDPAAEEAGIALSVALPERPVTVTGDRDLIAQALANLLENALRHAGRDAHVTVTVGADRTLSVADTGPGIPEAERENVLRRLYRLERSRTTPGNGLGLSLVTAIAQLHGAPPELSDAGPGLRVTLRFPDG